jgi:TatD DNase family protein
VKYIDAHSHWTDVRLNQDESTIKLSLELCAEKNIEFFLQGGVNPDEWLRQMKLYEKYPQNFGLCFGLHPYFVSEHTSESCEKALDQLAQLLPQAMALGEAGLDFRPHIMKESEGLQIEIFENQIELAKVFKKPMVLHLVQCHDKAIQIFDIWGVPSTTGFVHSFNGSYEVAKKYVDRGFLISVGGAITFDKNKKLQDCVKKLGFENLLIESDSPDQAPADWQDLNDSTSIFRVAEAIALLKNTNAFEVLEVTSSNFKRLFRL